MALPGKRLRANDAFGSISDNPLTAGSATFNSTQLVYIPVVSGDHLVITLDPLRQFGDPEIVVVTNHSGAATVATVTRGAYGTTPRSHPQGTIWVHAAVDEDFMGVVNFGSKPSNPYTGQAVFEYDTKKLVMFNGTDWAPRDAGGSLGYVFTTGSTQAGITTVVDITSLSTIVTIGTGRLIKISGEVQAQSTVADDTARLQIQEGATILQVCDQLMRPANTTNKMKLSIVLTPTPGSHTYKLTMQRIAGSGTITVNQNTPSVSQLLIEDIGAA